MRTTNNHKFIVAAMCCISLNLLLAADTPLTTQDIRIRDPYIYPDNQSKTYYMYAQSANRKDSDFIGVEAYKSKDLKNWTLPQPVLTLPNDADIKDVWAPEMHEYKGRYYLFVTLTYHKTLSAKKPVERAKWPQARIRGTHIFHADSPLGPFKPFKKTSHTPTDWSALDGTLFIENNIPYMIFCHEWIELIDGTMDYIQLKDDLSDTVGKPELMFKASNAPGSYKDPKRGKITDGCFLYRSPKSKKLFMIWSTYIPEKGYCVVLTCSESNSIKGPWKDQKLMYTQNGGHGMIFNSFDGRLMLPLHQPNKKAMERLHLFEITDNGETLVISKEVNIQ